MSIATSRNKSIGLTRRVHSRSAPKRMDVGILGATGVVGQQLATLLAKHPWFRVTYLAASDRSVGRAYGELPWRPSLPCSSDILALPVEKMQPGLGPKLIFSALDAAVADEAEAQFATAGHCVVSNAKSHRMDCLVPLLVPEINSEHLGLIAHQRKARGWTGAIVTNPNCSTIFLAMALAAVRQFKPCRVLVTTLQALSGAGYPGVSSLDATANVVPFIGGEEEKIESETKKILGSFVKDSIMPASFAVSAQATRVPVLYGHTETVSVEFEETVTSDEIVAAFRTFRGEPQRLDLPTAPPHPIVCTEAADRPQPRLDVEKFGGMAVQVGRLRPCPVLGHKFILLGHNTIRGAAGGTLLIAELMHALGMLV